MPIDAFACFDAPLSAIPDPLAIPCRERPFDLTLRPPGSKSITNRLYVLAALATGTSRIRRPLRSDDCDRLLAALVQLGATATWDEAAPDEVLIGGVGGRFPRGGTVDLGDGGTPTRFMLAAAALAAEPVVVDGSPRMRERPIAEGVAMLRTLGARIRHLGEDGCLPVEVQPSASFRGGTVAVGRTASSQFVSALLLVGPFLPDGITVEVREPLTSPSYIELTLDVLRPHAAAQVDRPRPPREAGGRMRVAGTADGTGGMPAAFDRTVEPDASAAIYWQAAAALVPGSVAWVPDLDLDGPQPDVRGCRAVEVLGVRAEAGPDGAGVRFEGRLERGGTLDASDWPDGALAVAAMSAAGRDPVTIHGLRTLRVKETDRIAALATELGRLGCTVESSDEHLTVDPRTRHERPVLISTYDDHRMAMAFGVLGLARPGITIHDPGCVAKSYPGFWADLGRVLRAE